MMQMSSNQTGGVVNTTRGSPLSATDAYWVAGFMLAGVVGLVLIHILFRKHVEL